MPQGKVEYGDGTCAAAKGDVFLVAGGDQESVFWRSHRAVTVLEITLPDSTSLN